MNKTEEFKRDWDGIAEDDNWDDWGDAEDFPVQEKEDTSKGATKNNPVKTKEKYNKNVESKVTAAEEGEHYDDSEGVDPRESQFTRDSSAQLNKSTSWDLWGVLSKATEGLGSITTTVSQGLNQVIGFTDPEELARLNAAETAKNNEHKHGEYEEEKEHTGKEPTKQQQSSATPAFGLSLVSGVTSLGSKVLNTGLDTLEGIGKKTMHILQENDPLLMNKRKLLGLEPHRPNLSEILKEARKDADQLENTLKELKLEKSKQQFRFDVIFENYCGLVHLEALEILSKQSNLKLQTLLNAVSGNALTELQETINEVKELMELEELEGESEGDYDANALEKIFTTAVEDADIKIHFNDIINNWSQSLDWLATSAAAANEQEIFVKGITALAETCALEVSKLHKIAELMLVKEHHSTANEVDGIVQLCKQFNAHLNGVTNRYAAVLIVKDTEEAKALISTLFGEMLTALQQIEISFRLFVPILQIGAL